MGLAQNFKGDELELKFRGAGEPALDLTSSALDDFYEQGDMSDAFLLMLYDEGRVPFSERIGRDVFVPFVRQAFENFPFIGNFESYLFILHEIFGADALILFDVPAPGRLQIDVSAVSDTVFEAIAREFTAGQYEFFNLATSDDDDLVFRGLSGISSEHDLELLISEIVPAGIVPEITLEFFSIFVFIGEEAGDFFGIITQDGDEIVFIEVAG